MSVRPVLEAAARRWRGAQAGAQRPLAPIVLLALGSLWQALRHIHLLNDILLSLVLLLFAIMPNAANVPSHIAVAAIPIEQVHNGGPQDGADHAAHERNAQSFEHGDVISPASLPQDPRLGTRIAL